MTSSPEFNAFALLVFKMRSRQREYFKKPIVGKLIAAKAAERLVDDELQSLNGVQQLFPAEPSDVETETHA